jgi:carbamoyltransferase
VKIIGIHDGHNASVSYLEDGFLKFAIQEERLNLIKNYWGFPYKSLDFLLSKFGLNHETIDAIVFSSKNMPKGMDRDGLLRAHSDDSSIYRILRNRMAENSMYRLLTGHRLRNMKFLNLNMEKRRSNLNRYGISSDKVHFVDHHLSHASAVYYGLRHDDAPCLILTLDGGGDALCATVSIGKGGEITRISETTDGHSVGNIYSRITFLMGFIPWEHEYKLMGMAPYASSERSDRVRKMFASYLDLDAEDPMRFKRKIPEATRYVTKRLEKDIRGIRFDDICGGLQLFTEELIVRWVKECISRTGIRRVFCSGGVFMNVKANKRVFELPEVETISVFPSCGDETNSIGAAFFWARQNGDAVARLSHFYTGHHFSDDSVREEIEKSNLPYRYFDDINEKVAELLASREIVARCTGPMEFGARALGNRSILADPSYYDCVRVINLMVKKRDFWMPFAPVIKEERLHEYVFNPKNQESPFMMLTFDTTEKRVEFMAAVHNADLTARAQILSRGSNPQFYDLLTKYEAKTGSGVLLNNSFNLHGYPIVLGPREAINVFINSGLKYLVLENYLLWK